MFKNAARRIRALLAEYGPIAVGVWLTTWAVAFVGFTLSSACAFAAAGEPVGWCLAAGTAYPAFLATYPLRVGATVALTPPLARLLRRLFSRR